jgi:hypothetical protein
MITTPASAAPRASAMTTLTGRRVLTAPLRREAQFADNANKPFKRGTKF